MSVGDVTSTERGSGARFNSGKPAVDLIPFRLISMEAPGSSDLMVRASLALNDVAAFQERQLEDYTGQHLILAMRQLNYDGQAWADCARVLEYGKKKYAAWNWSKGMSWSIPLACFGRHSLDIFNGEVDDEESGLPHRGHLMANLVMLATFVRTFKEGDDLPPKGMLS